MLVGHILVWERVHVPWSGLGSQDREQLRSPLHVILHYKRVSASTWACFQHKALIEGLVWHCSRDRRLQEVKFRYLYQNAFIRACPNCGSQIQVRKLACPCGMNFLHILSYVLWLCVNTTCRGLSTSVLFITLAFPYLNMSHQNVGIASNIRLTCDTHNNKRGYTRLCQGVWRIDTVVVLFIHPHIMVQEGLYYHQERYLLVTLYY